jgi:hypothetical protein
MSLKRFHYDAALKRKVIKNAAEHENRAAGRKFKKSEANVRRWRNDRASIFSCKATTKSFTGPTKGRHPDVDAAVLHFVKDTRAKGMPITRQAMQVKTTETAKSLGITKFKAGRGWCDRFMRRERLSLRHRTSICQKIPADFQEKLINFQQYVN